MMKEREKHIEWSTLNDYADGVLPASARDEAERHLNSCAECRSTLARLREVLATVNGAPAEVTPPAESWEAIRSRIEARKVVALPPTSGLRPPTAHRSPLTALRFAAAAAILVAASSALTVVVMNRAKASDVVAFAVDSGAPGVQNVSMPGDFAKAERGYLETAGELSAALDAARASLAPETVRAVERNLRIIDEAIAEARAALLNDPANFALRDLLKKGYEQKVDFLRRATARYLET